MSIVEARRRLETLLVQPWIDAKDKKAIALILRIPFGISWRKALMSPLRPVELRDRS
jgi:hypothetical protein